MRSRWSRVVLSSCLVVALAGQGQDFRLEKPSEQLLARLPAEWRVTVSHLDMTADQQRRYLGLGNDELQGALLRSLAFSHPEATDFVLDHVETLRSAKDEADVIQLMAYADHWAENPRVIALLNSFTAPGRDAQLALAAFHTLNVIERHRERILVEKLLASTEGASRRELLAQDEYLMDAEKGAVVPSYMRRVPPIFEAVASKPSIRVLGFGDFGTGGPDQKQVAAAMVEYHKQHPFDFGITMGDNFTPIGMASPDDERWQSRWEQLYGPMKIKFYPTFGNHDWSSPESPAAELSYKSPAGNWVMPSPYYTFTAGPAQFFAIDTGVTGAMSLAQLDWLKSELDKSRAHWKIVYGHHMPYLAAATGEVPLMVRQLMPILKGRADVYIAGHYHSLERLKPVDGVNLYISAGGGRPLYPIDPASTRALFARSVYGFSVMEIDGHRLTQRFIAEDGKLLDESSIEK